MTRRRDPVKEAARHAAQRAFPDPQPCEKCGGGFAQRHHDDYSKPLDIRWLCQPCHTDHHRTEVHGSPSGACKGAQPEAS